MSFNTVQKYDDVILYLQVAGIPPSYKLIEDGCNLTLNRINDKDAVQLTLKKGTNTYTYLVTSDPKATPRHSQPQPDFLSVVCDKEPIGLSFKDSKTTTAVADYLTVLLQQLVQSEFDMKTDKSSSQQYFHYYGQANSIGSYLKMVSLLAQQQNMLQDLVRTGTYQKAMIDNAKDFNGAVVLDVGAGTGMLSFFALQAGAKKVYAIEASNMADFATTLAHSNGYGDRLIVIKGKVEEIDLPEKVDIIVSEPMGILLVNERMLETYMIARKWLKPNGLMFPTTGVIYMAPFQDDYLYMETFTKSTFWSQPSFYGVDLRSLNQSAIEEYFTTPIVDSFDPRIVLAQPVRHTIDFLHTSLSEMEKIKMPFSYSLTRPATIHGLCFWFDVLFSGSEQDVWLSTGPYTPLTHWYQVRCVLREPLQVGAGQVVVGEMTMVANSRQSYNIHMELGIQGSTHRVTGQGNLKDPFYRVSDYQQTCGLTNMTSSLNSLNSTTASMTPFEEGQNSGETEMCWSAVTGINGNSKNVNE